MQKHVNLEDLVKSFPTNIFLQNLASLQKRTSPIKFDHLTEESEKGSISILSTKFATSRCRERSGGDRLAKARAATAWSRYVRVTFIPQILASFLYVSFNLLKGMSRSAQRSSSPSLPSNRMTGVVETGARGGNNAPLTAGSASDATVSSGGRSGNTYVCSNVSFLTFN